MMMAFNCMISSNIYCRFSNSQWSSTESLKYLLPKCNNKGEGTVTYILTSRHLLEAAVARAIFNRHF